MSHKIIPLNTWTEYSRAKQIVDELHAKVRAQSISVSDLEYEIELIERITEWEHRHPTTVLTDPDSNFITAIRAPGSVELVTEKHLLRFRINPESTFPVTEHVFPTTTCVEVITKEHPDEK